jgi:hypothetical protein
MLMNMRSWRMCASVLLLLLSRVARADPAPPVENALEDPIADGDIDEEDLPVVSPIGPVGVVPLSFHGGSWVGLVGFSRLLSNQNDVGGMLVVGLALDRLSAGPVRQLADPVPDAPARTSPSAPRPALVTPSLARACVAAALRSSGLGADDSRIDALVARARASAWLPEARMRVARLIVDSARAATLATTDGTNYYETIGAHLMLELRLTWRLDRLLYAGDEPALERTRLERQEARSRLAGRALEMLFTWQRAVVEARGALAGSEQETQAWLRASEAQASLDVLTAGWFSRRSE